MEVFLGEISGFKENTVVSPEKIFKIATSQRFFEPGVCDEATFNWAMDMDMGMGQYL